MPRAAWHSRLISHFGPPLQSLHPPLNPFVLHFGFETAMSDRRFRFGVLVSVLWLLVMLWTALRRPDLAAAMEPNEWGDFFAGLFAPLAFLWLVLGYLQQGEELKLSTKALLLQAEELRNSVEQQRELVEVTRQQVEADREALRDQLRARREAAKPRFAIVNHGGNFSGDGRGTYSLVIANAGSTVRRVIGVIDEPIKGNRTLIDVALLASGTEHSTSFSIVEPLPTQPLTLRISYLDSDDNAGLSTFRVQPQSEAPNSLLSFIPTEA